MGYRDYVKTIEDLEKLYYSDAGAKFITKADAPVLSTTTGVYNAVFGAQAWSQLNLEANAFGVLPKIPQLRSGWRVITARASGSVTGGQAENATLPDTIKPTFAEVSTKPKTVVHNFDVSELQEFLALSGDDAIGDMAFMRQYMAVEHAEHLNKMLLTDFDTLASNNLESLDRVVASDNEETSESYTAGDADIYGIDRSANAWSDAYVNHNSNTDRVLTDTLIRTLIRNVLANGARPTFYLTGYDTYASIQGEYDPQVRYLPTAAIGQTEIQPSVNGIMTPAGIGTGLKVATVYGYPVILSKNTPTDTISRLYLLDTSNAEGFDLPRLCVRVAKPTQYFEAGMNQGDPFGINRLGNEGMYRIMGELICTFFKAQGKIRDLK